jgi:hypothetical protein
LNQRGCALDVDQPVAGSDNAVKIAAPKAQENVLLRLPSDSSDLLRPKRNASHGDRASAELNGHER